MSRWVKKGQKLAGTVPAAWVCVAPIDIPKKLWLAPGLVATLPLGLAGSGEFVEPEAPILVAEAPAAGFPVGIEVLTDLPLGGDPRYAFPDPLHAVGEGPAHPLVSPEQAKGFALHPALTAFSEAYDSATAFSGLAPDSAADPLEAAIATLRRFVAEEPSAFGNGLLAALLQHQNDRDSSTLPDFLIRHGLVLNGTFLNERRGPVGSLIYPYTASRRVPEPAVAAVEETVGASKLPSAVLYDIDAPDHPRGGWYARHGQVVINVGLAEASFRRLEAQGRANSYFPDGVAGELVKVEANEYLHFVLANKWGFDQDTGADWDFSKDILLPAGAHDFNTHDPDFQARMVHQFLSDNASRAASLNAIRGEAVRAVERRILSEQGRLAFLGVPAEYGLTHDTVGHHLIDFHVKATGQSWAKTREAFIARSADARVEEVSIVRRDFVDEMLRQIDLEVIARAMQNQADALMATIKGGPNRS